MAESGTGSSPQREILTPQAVAAGLRRAGILDPGLTQCVTLAGGTASRVAALSRPGGEPTLVIKLNSPAEVRAEAQFLGTYSASPLLPSLRHLDPAGRFLVCDFRRGAHVRYGEDEVDVAGALLILVRDLLSRYVPADEQHNVAQVVELLEAPDAPAEAPPTAGSSRTWPRYLGDHVAYQHKPLAAYLPAADGRVVEQLARARRRAEPAPLSLLHGDCGAHNFLFRKGSDHLGPLDAVIDPYPLVGYPIFDLAFAFVSWPNGLLREAIVPAAEALRASGRWQPGGDPYRILAEEVLIALYNRMAACLVHHPRDLPTYLAAWPRWRRLALGGA